VSIYYVNATDGDDAKDGKSEANAWKTIAKVNNSSFNPGDSILFKRGEVWRTPLTVPSSGSSGNPITFGAYGTGAKPIINASTVYSSWSTEDEVILDKPSTDDYWSIADVDGHQWGGQSNWNPGSNYTISAVEVNIRTVTGSATYEVGIYKMTGNDIDLVNLPTGTNTSQLVIDSTGIKKFTGLSCQVVNGTKYAITISRADRGVGTNWLQVYTDTSDTWSGEFRRWYEDGTNAGGLDTQELGVKLYQTVANLYYANYTDQPKQVFFDGVLLTKNTVSKETLTTGEWFDDTVNNRIYLYDNPSGHVVEGSDWARCIFTNNKSYLIFENLELRRSNGHNFWLDTANGRFDDITVQNCIIRQAYNHGLGAGLGGFAETGEGVSTGLQILNNEFIENGIQAVADGTGTGFAINIGGNSPTDYIEDVLVQGNTSNGDSSGFKADWFANDQTWRENYIECVGTAFACDGGQDITWEYNIIDNTNVDHSGFAFSIYRWEGDPGPPYGFAIDNCRILNNVMYGYKKGVNLEDDQVDTIVKNNIFYSNFSDNTPVQMEGGETRTGLDINNNCYYTGEYTPAFTITGIGTYNYTEWQALGHDANSVNSNPLFVDASNGNFSLQDSSPCIDAGIDVSLTSDYNGSLVPMGNGTPDIGAIEYARFDSGVQTITSSLQAPTIGTGVTLSAGVMEITTSVPTPTISTTIGVFGMGLDINMDMRL